ncbi:hypothetical protein [Amycolatopsis australiensis]|uniref:Uncharacterized protein n=1 Tax=Amycolatopsis australiensis TaxID=546364 RepID=A0A1K1RY44_9PSEU|nr:hypothetical protein [Amycolatopsis australiensis]SFW76966.1 hypothetical protein SAMN04489730_4224 [Amycolatopsis australiensis]
MTEHLTRHGSEQDEEHTGRAIAGEPGTAEVPGQDRDGFHDSAAADDRDDNRDDDRTLSTADLASASAQQRTESGSDTAETTGAAPDRSGGDVETPQLIDEEKITGFRDRWQNVQTGFVDDPKQAVREADELVAAVISALATTFAEHKSELEAQWQQGEPATEELRIALRRYRSFFDQLLPR